MHTLDYFRHHRAAIQQSIGYQFSDLDLLQRAFVHKSFINEGGGLVLEHNERLEFLGDAVLDLLVSRYLFELYPDQKEGILSLLRAKLVDTNALIRYVNRLGLAEFLVLGKGEKQSSRNQSIFANLFEAVIGAIYLDSNIEATKTFFFTKCEEEIRSLLDKPTQNAKAILQDYTQKTFKEKPIYTVIHEMGSDHAKVFTMEVRMQENVLGFGVGSSKKDAERKAAEDALEKLHIEAPLDLTELYRS